MASVAVAGSLAFILGCGAELGGYFLAAHLYLEEFLNLCPAALVALAYKCDRFAVGIGARRASYAVYIVCLSLIAVYRYIVIS